MQLVRRPLIRALSPLALAAWGSACQTAQQRVPAASFLLVAGDSTFWVQSGPAGTITRRSPLMLARVEGRYHELYISDDDLSYRDALLVGQHIWRRDLASGDSVIVRFDHSIADLAGAYATAHPAERPLAEDEDTNDNPRVQATSDTELLDVVGPFLSYELHLDVDIQGERDQHVTQRGVVDLRSGKRARVEDLVGVTEASAVYEQAHGKLVAALDSVRRATGERATRARRAIAGFVFDSTSFELLDRAGGPTVAFLVPGRGPRAGGHALPLGEIALPRAGWWGDVTATLPSSESPSTAVWADTAYDIVVTAGTLDTNAAVGIRYGGQTLTVTTVPLPVRRVFRLGGRAGDAAERRALTQAFDESEAYGGVTLPASWRHYRESHAPLPFRLTGTWTPNLSAIPKPSSPTS